MAKPPQGRVLNPEQAAEFLSVSRSWLIREAARKGKVPFIRAPGSNKYLFLESDLWSVLKAWRHDGPVGRPPKDWRDRSKSKARSKSPKRKGRK